MARLLMRSYPTRSGRNGRYPDDIGQKDPAGHWAHRTLIAMTFFKDGILFQKGHGCPMETSARLLRYRKESYPSF